MNTDSPQLEVLTKYKVFRLSVLLLIWLVFVADVFALTDQEAKMAEVTQTLEAILKIPDSGIPERLLQKAAAIAIIPNVNKVGFVVGGRYGKGVISSRNEDGSWSNPVFVSVSGGSVGWQIGAQSTDLVLVFISSKGIDKLAGGSLALGADVAVAVGPLGRHAAASADASLKTEVYSYSRSRGLFAGIALDGAVLKLQPRDGAQYYRYPGLRSAQVFSGELQQVPASAIRLKKLLLNSTGTEE